jgi:hypothetical protein
MLVSTVWFWNHGQRAPVVGGVVAGWFGECFGGFGERETPGPIPNPVAKLLSADGTALVGVWESRTPPDLTREMPGSSDFGLLLPGISLCPGESLFTAHNISDLSDCRAVGVPVWPHPVPAPMKL